MKKLLLVVSLVLLLVNAGFAQQRLCLLEEFTQASCGPCASQNPALNAMLDANSSKVVSIKYQTSFPGFDPMYLHNPTQVDNRADFYTVGGVPDIYFDGNVILAGSPSDLTTAAINAQYAVLSPVNMTLSHSFSADLSTITVNTTINGLSALPAGYKLRIAVVEKTITFPTAPGTNGETDFYSIMKRMLPSEAGITLPAIAAGATQSYTESWTLANIYKMDEIAVVAFIQDDATKNVKQTAISEPVSLPAGIPFAAVNTLNSGITGAPNCTSTVSPTVTIKNQSTVTVTSFTINYNVGATAGSSPWTGSLAPGAISAPISLSAVTAGAGTSVISASCTNINGSGISGGMLIAPTSTVAILSSSATASTLVEPFGATPPAGSAVYDESADGRTWSLFAGLAIHANAYVCDFYSGINSAGNKDWLYMKSINLAGVTSAALAFDVASSKYSATAESDRLQILVSVDCGATWQATSYDKAGATLNTIASATTAAFVPTNAQWRTESAISLNSFVGQPNVLIAFKGTSGYGNRLYVDNVNVTSSTVGIAESELSNAIAVFPNPVSETLFINGANINLSVIEVLDATGKIIKIMNDVSNNAISVAGLANGTYMLRITTDAGVAVKRFNVAR